MPLKIKKVGVIGAGVMGATIAAHMANAGLETLLLDIVPPKMPPELEKKGVDPSSRTYRDYLASKGLEGALKAKPAAFFVPEDAQLVSVGNLEDDLGRLGECDWIIEVVVERLDIKRQVLSRLAEVRAPHAIVTTNTSGLSIAQMSEGLPEDFQRHFFGTHFFNPPRYMRLFEIIPGPKTDPALIEEMARFATERLGKGVVFAKDTPNFIANRVGIFGICYINHLVDEMDLGFEEVDALTGTVIGRPKMATYRLADLVGLDVIEHVASNVYERATDDPQRDVFILPEWFKQMISNGWLGTKAGQGFYKKTKDASGKKQVLVLDRGSMEYREPAPRRFESLEAAKQAPSGAPRLKALYYAGDTAGVFTFKHLSATLAYCASLIPEVSEDIVNLDNAMRWGFNWQWGPFEMWDLLGVEASLKKMQEAGFSVPQWVKDMVAAGNKSFYKTEGARRYYYDPMSATYKPVPVPEGVISLALLKAEEGRVIASNKGATLIDLGDGVVCVEFHTKMNALGPEIVTMLNRACDLVEEEKFQAIVVANQGRNFSVGANLMLVLFTAQEEEWDELEWMVRQLQNTYMRLKYLPGPVIAAPHQMALGGGCELCLHADRVVAAAETYAGLVEVGVGVIPAGGGTKELLLRNCHERVFKVPRGGVSPAQIFLLPFVARAFETIALAKISTSAREAIKMGLFRPTDKICMNPDLLLKRAKDNALAMLMAGYTPPRPVNNIRVMGRDAMGTFQYVIYNMRKAGYITDHDVTVATELARVLTGGNVLPNTEVSEQYILDLEREAFLRLCGMPKTQARMAHMLKTGKPLRN